MPTNPPKRQPKNVKKIGTSKAREIIPVSNYKLGYRNREDVTNLPPGVLIVGSQNVLTNVSERVQIRKGYELDGATSSVIAAIKSSFDWATRGNGEKHLRAGFLTIAGNDGALQYRYVDPTTQAVSWRDLLTGRSSVDYNFTQFWDTAEQLRVALFVDGNSYIQEWNGAVTELLSATANTITKAGDTWLDTGFYNQTLATIGGNSTRFDITNPAGTTFRYTYDGTGTDPGISATTVPVGSYILIGAQNFNAANNGLFVVTASDTNYFEVINASGVAENNVTIGTGYIYATFKNVLIINGVAYGYTGGVATNTLTGVTPDPSASVAGDVIHQAVITTPNSAMSGITSTFANGLISVLNNQIFLGSLTSSVMWLSYVNSYTNYTSSATRQVGEGGSLILDQNLVAFNVTGNQDLATMYVSAGTDIWYKITFTDFVSVVGASGQTIGAVPIKTGKRQGAISQAFVSNMKNNTIAVSNEPTIDLMGVMANYFTQIQTQNISDSIKLDVDSYDFTGGSIFYHRYYIYVAVPAEGLVLIFNVATGSWESPQTLPISRFYIVDGELYGHSCNTSESYKLFTGFADRVYPGFIGSPISAKWVFSYQNFGTRTFRKSANVFYVEGYINSNTIADAVITYELDGCATTKTFEIDGSDRQIVCLPSSMGELGKMGLGKQKLGGTSPTSIQDLPPKFRVMKTFSNTDFFECSISFEVVGINNRLELLAFGLNASASTQEPVSIKQ